MTVKKIADHWSDLLFLDHWRVHDLDLQTRFVVWL